MEVVAKVISGEHGSIVIRQKAGQRIEIGDLLVIDGEPKYILQVFNLQYSSLHDPKFIQHLSGKSLEKAINYKRKDWELRYFVLAEVKAILEISSEGVRIPKSLPEFFSDVRMIREEDLEWLKKPDRPLYLGKLRSGSKLLDFDIYIDGHDALTHHILIPATTGRGKSNLMKVILWDMLGEGRDYAGMLVLDPHDEYFKALRDHPLAGENLIYYTPGGQSIRGARTLEISMKTIKPWHFSGIVNLTDAQRDAMYVFRNMYDDDWLVELLKYRPDISGDIRGVQEATVYALQRKLKITLGVDVEEDGTITSFSGVFTPTSAGATTVKDIVSALEKGKKVVIDTSRLGDQAELLVASIVANEILNRYKRYMSDGSIDNMPVVSIVLEEAPRVLSTPTGEPSIFGTIAREGRKFKVGLIAITQLVSMIPHEVLANMNTKIILGNEMANERKAIIASASQDLSRDDKMIASLDKGEAIVSSVFTKFAIPIKAPLFDDYRQSALKQENERKKDLSRLVFE